jgi:tRNA(adenine34) deaminase
MTQNPQKDIDIEFMKLSLEEASRAFSKKEVPVGAVIVKESKIIARAHNIKESINNPIAHAEMLAIEKASKKLNNWRLTGCTLYVNLEPCPMCAGAMILARIDRLVFGAYDLKSGACGSKINIFKADLNHYVKITGGILEKESEKFLKSFFNNIRD